MKSTFLPVEALDLKDDEQILCEFLAYMIVEGCITENDAKQALNDYDLTK